MTIDGKCIKIGSVEDEKIKCEAKDNHYWNDYYNDCRCRDGYEKKSGNCVMTDATKNTAKKATNAWKEYKKTNSSTGTFQWPSTGTGVSKLKFGVNSDVLGTYL